MKFVLGFLSCLGFAAYGMALISLCGDRLFDLPQFTSAFVGFIAGAGVWLVLRRRLGFFSVFEHELTHLIFGLLMFQRPRSFYASDKRGHVSSEGGNFVDGLAPYFFPTFSYLLLAVFPLLRPATHTYFFPVLGFLTGYHLVSNIGEFKLTAGDIRKAGKLFSTVFCLFAGTVTFGFLLAFVADGFTGGVNFLTAGGYQAGTILVYAGGLGRDLVSALRVWTGPP